jgi:hypothetical protein
VPLDRAEAERLYQLAVRSGAAHAAHALTRASIGTLDGAVTGLSRGVAPAVAIQLTRDAVYGLNLAVRGGEIAAAEHLATLTGRRDVTSACCVGCGASRKLKTCSKCSVALFCDMECTTRMWPAHKASCKAWRKDPSGQAEDYARRTGSTAGTWVELCQKSLERSISDSVHQSTLIRSK